MSTQFTTIEFRAWTGRQMLYQNDQYLASFIHYVTSEIIADHGGWQSHESWLPNGGDISEYLQQFTGCKDKNNKKGYRDDLVHIVKRSLYCITWDSERAAFRLKSLERNEPDLDMSQLHYGEIVGNIHENPNLLPAEEVQA